MSSLSQLPATFEQAAPVLERYMQETNAAVLQVAGTNRRPLPPRSLIAQGGSLQILLTWNADQLSSNVTGWRVYKDNESNLFLTITDPSVKKATIAVPANKPTGLYVSAVNALGQESIKVFIIGKATTDQFVVTGTSGGTGGTTPNPPPGYTGEPTGGNHNPKVRDL